MAVIKNKIKLIQLTSSKFNIVVCTNKNKILEKLGRFNLNLNIMSLNVFRLIFWLSKNYIIAGKLLLLLADNYIVTLKKKKC